MNRFLKLSAQIIGLIIALYLVLMVCLYIFIQTKDFKPIVTKAFYEKTGLVLKVDGNIKLSVFPWPGIRATNMIVENPKGFPAPSSAKYLAKIGNVQVTLHMSGLFHGKVNPRNVLLKDIDINLITAKSGKTNWESLMKFANNPGSKDTKAKAQQNNSQDLQDASMFPVVEVSNTNVHFINLSTQTQTDISKLALRSPASRKPLQRELSIDCQIAHKNPYSLMELTFNTVMHKASNSPRIDFNNIKVLAKWLAVKHTFNQPVILVMRGNLTLNNGDFTTKMSGNFDESEGNIFLKASRSGGVITNKTVMKKADLPSLSKILTGKKWLDGDLNATINLRTSGDSFQQWIGRLSGNGSLKATDGKILGLNLSTLVAGTLNNLLGYGKGNQPSAESQGVTVFNDISASFTIASGILKSNDLVLNSNRLKATGSGIVNLPQTTINAKLLTTYVDNPKWQLPLLITGDLTSPKVQPDTSDIAKQVLKDKLQKDVGKTLDKVKKQFQNIFN